MDDHDAIRGLLLAAAASLPVWAAVFLVLA